MKTQNINRDRRKFFTKVGFGFIAGGIASTITGKLFHFTAKEKTLTAKNVSVTINPMAVKRTNKG
jgi:hypothetical protein